jgi:molybdopterin-dependent oxidoreductase alpha subunit
MVKLKKNWNPNVWASWKPFGIGEQRPNNYFEVFRAAWENRDQLDYAYRILRDGVCDGCALGTKGLSDWTLPGPHLCNIRLRLLRLNTMPALDSSLLNNVSSLRQYKSRALRELGRLPYPMIRRHGEAGFTRITWDQALGRIASRIKASSPDRLGVYVTSRGMPNEGYYGIGKAVRGLGTNNIDNAARICHAPSTVALKETIGVAATTCSYTDWIGSDLIVFIGSNPANNQPVATKYLHYAKKAGTKVVCVNTYVEPGMDRYWVPSVPESALFGTRITDRWFLVNTGGDAAFLTGVLKHIVHNNLENTDWIKAHTSGFDTVREHVLGLDWAELERQSGSTRLEMQALGQMLGEARTAVLVWSMGITQHACGEDNVRAIVNLGLSRGFVGRDKCGLMPIRGHSGVQGGAEMGAYATAFPGGKPVNLENAKWLESEWGFPVPSGPGLSAPEMLEAARDGKLETLISIGGNFLEVLPDPDDVQRSLEAVPLRVHFDICLSSQMLLDGQEVILLPAMTRYEVPGGVTETSTERRIILSPEIPGPRVKEARPEFEVMLELARRVRPEIAARLEFAGMPAMRAEIARVVPSYAGIERLALGGDSVQYGGPHLCANGRFPLPDERARFARVSVSDASIPDGLFRVSTRRGKQFNSMVHALTDALNGAEREAVLIASEDASRLGLLDGDTVKLVSDHGEYVGCARIAAVKPGNLQVHWPEGNVLLDPRKRSRESHVPDYNAFVRLEKNVSGRASLSAAD